MFSCFNQLILIIYIKVIRLDRLSKENKRNEEMMKTLKWQLLNSSTSLK